MKKKYVNQQLEHFAIRPQFALARILWMILWGLRRILEDPQFSGVRFSSNLFFRIFRRYMNDVTVIFRPHPTHPEAIL